MLSQANVNANAKSEAATMSSLWRFLYCNVCTQAYKDLNIHTQTHVCTHRHTHTAVLQRSGDKSRYWNPSSLTAINYSVWVCVWQLVRQLCACLPSSADTFSLSAGLWVPREKRRRALSVLRLGDKTQVRTHRCRASLCGCRQRTVCVSASVCASLSAQLKWSPNRAPDYIDFL